MFDGQLYQVVEEFMLILFSCGWTDMTFIFQGRAVDPVFTWIICGDMKGIFVVYEIMLKCYVGQSMADRLWSVTIILCAITVWSPTTPSRSVIVQMVTPFN